MAIITLAEADRRMRELLEKAQALRGDDLTVKDRAARKIIIGKLTAYFAEAEAHNG